MLLLNGMCIHVNVHVHENAEFLDAWDYMWSSCVLVSIVHSACTHVNTSDPHCVIADNEEEQRKGHLQFTGQIESLPAEAKV